MKKFILYAALGIATVSMFAGCGAEPVTEAPTTEMVTTEVPAPEYVPDITQIREIFELSVMTAKYHNVAKGTKAPGTGLEHFGERERKFWVEFTGVVDISYDASQIMMRRSGEDISITLPAPIIQCSVEPDSWSTEKVVESSDNIIQKNPITAEDTTQAINDAVAKMETEVRNNTTLLESAENQAKYLIENYIKQVGDATGVEYKITWR